MNWWKTGADGNKSPVKPATWDRNQIDVIQTDGAISSRALQNIRQEVASCLAHLGVSQPPLTAPVWRPQGHHPQTRRSLPPILNREACMPQLADAPMAPAASTNQVLQVVNNYTTIQGSLPSLPARQLVADVLSTADEAETPRFQDQTSKRVGSKPRKFSPFIPKSPRNVAAVIRHWIMPSPGEGVQKALVYFNEEERNKHGDAHKKLFSKRKTVAVAFLLFVLKNSVAEYESAFGSLQTSLKVSLIYKKSASYLREAQGRKEYNSRLSDRDLQKLTEEVVKKRRLRKLVCPIRKN